MTQALHGGHKQTPKTEAQIQFYPQLIQADTNLSAFTAQLKRLGQLDFSLCLYMGCLEQGNRLMHVFWRAS